MIEQVVNVERIEQIINLFGSFDENIKLLEKEYNVHIINRDTELRISGDAEDVSEAIRTQKWKMVCVNDSEKVVDIEVLRNKVAAAFDVILGEKSAYEK